MIRITDIFLSLNALILFSPVLLLCVVTIRLYDGGPAFFLQERVGKDLQLFQILKFRTMHVSRDASRSGSVSGDNLAAKRAARAAFQATQVGDPRITPIGRILRPLHLDELPQLINVLKGDMSLVGVRPDTPAQEVDYDPEYWKVRHKYLPGITGVAQIMAKESTIEERRRLELKWLSNPSLRYYFFVLFRTVHKVLRRTSL
ncbi:MAG: sugar transferase [Pseudomonadota bacterium]